jgi:hypothetical protein
MNNLVTSLSIVFCFTFGAASAHADSAGQGGMASGQFGDKIFKAMDSNGDGSISRAEFDAFHASRFKETDTDGDGKITPDEMRAEQKKIAEAGKDKRFDEADANHDGVLTREESKKIPMLFRHFDEMDGNHDNKVTRAEMDFAMEYWRRKREAMKHPG